MKRKEIKDVARMFVPGRSDITVNHSHFMQCFLPIRPLSKGKDQYVITNGNLRLAITAGNLFLPENPNEFKKQEVPAGAKARLIVNYMNHMAYTQKTRHIDMGKSLYRFMKDNNIPICGSNAKEIQRQVKNVAAAHFYLGLKHEDGAMETRRLPGVVESTILGVPKEDFELWDNEIVLSERYYESLRDHGVPTNALIMVALQNNPRAMDLYCWLTYRGPQVKFPIKVKYGPADEPGTLHNMFGRHIKEPYHFRQEFKKALNQVNAVYPINVDISNKDYIIVYNCEPSVPYISSVGVSHRGLFNTKRSD